MKKFKTYLTNNGIQTQTANAYVGVTTKYTDWLKTKNLKASKIKRSQFTDWLQLCREQGNKESTITIKENIIKSYYDFLGVKNNPAKRWIERKKEHKLPPTAIEKETLIKIYESLKPKSPTEYRNRCMLGFVFFQGLKRSELEELRTQDINFETGEVFIQGQLKTNARRLKLESVQMFHLYDYFNKFRKEFLSYKETETDRLFISMGNGSRLDNAVNLLLNKLRKEFPEVKTLKHIRGSVITHWQKQDGIIEAMVKAGHRYVSSTQRYQTNKYDELQNQLKNIHPLEHINI